MCMCTHTTHRHMDTHTHTQTYTTHTTSSPCSLARKQKPCIAIHAKKKKRSPIHWVCQHDILQHSCHHILCMTSPVRFSSVAQSCLTLRPHEPQHARPPCPSQTPGVYSNSCPLGQWCHQAISSSVIPFSSCPQSLPASGYFPMSQLVAWGGQSIGVSASASWHHI